MREERRPERRAKPAYAPAASYTAVVDDHLGVRTNGQVRRPSIDELVALGELTKEALPLGLEGARQEKPWHQFVEHSRSNRTELPRRGEEEPCHLEVGAHQMAKEVIAEQCEEERSLAGTRRRQQHIFHGPPQCSRLFDHLTLDLPRHKLARVLVGQRLLTRLLIVQLELPHLHLIALPTRPRHAGRYKRSETDKQQRVAVARKSTRTRKRLFRSARGALGVQ